MGDSRRAAQQIFQPADETAIFQWIGAQFLERQLVQVRVDIGAPLAGVVVTFAVFRARIVIQFKMIVCVD